MDSWQTFDEQFSEEHRGLPHNPSPDQRCRTSLRVHYGKWIIILLGKFIEVISLRKFPLNFWDFVVF